MLPTIQPEDRVFVNKMAYDLRVPFTTVSIAKISEPIRGDIVVFQSPKDPSIRLIKRLIGLPGDRVGVKNGWISVNGVPLEKVQVGELLFKEGLGETDHFVNRLVLETDQERESHEYQVPSGHYFFMGDNRDNSLDSRSWGYGLSMVSLAKTILPPPL